MKAFPAHQEADQRTIITKLIPITRTTYVIHCAWCGEKFYATRNDATYCSGRCRSAAFRKRQKDRKHFAEIQETEPLFDASLYREDYAELHGYDTVSMQYTD